MPAVKKIYTLLSGLILCSIVILLVITIKYNNTLRDASAAVHYTIVVLNETQQALSAVLNFDLGQERSDITAHVRAIGLLTVDNPIQQARVDSMLHYIYSDHPQDQTNNMRAVLLRMQGEENRLLALREEINLKNQDQLRTATSILLAGILSLLGTSLFIIFYNFRRRRQVEKELKEYEQRFSLLVQHVKDYSIFMLDPEGRVMSWNEGAENIKGYKAQEIIGKYISVLYTDEEIARNEPSNNLREAAAKGSYECFGWRRRKDGTLFFADVVFTAIHYSSGQLTGFAKITRDITEQMRIQEEMRLSLIREKELNEMKSRFVTIASHEFKTPLSVILSSTSLIEKYNAPEMEDKRQRHIQRVKSNVKNLRQILNDFLSLEKLEAGVIRNNPAPLHLPELVTEVIQDMEESCKPGQEIVFTVDGTSHTTAVDEHLLRNILNNLISNAIKYSPEHTTILFILQFLPGSISFHITDQGIGIPAAEQDHLFQRFFRATNTAGIPGTGLGLSIVKRYLDLMGGDIEVSSQPGKGTTFSVSLLSAQ